MTKAYAVGADVSWNWGKGEGRGAIREVFKKRVQRTIKGSKVTRRATEDNPAYLLEQEDGDRVLKSHSELERA